MTDISVKIIHCENPFIVAHFVSFALTYSVFGAVLVLEMCFHSEHVSQRLFVHGRTCHQARWTPTRKSSQHFKWTNVNANAVALDSY